MKGYISFVLPWEKIACCRVSCLGAFINIDTRSTIGMVCQNISQVILPWDRGGKNNKTFWKLAKMKELRCILWLFTLYHWYIGVIKIYRWVNRLCTWVKKGQNMLSIFLNAPLSHYNPDQGSWISNISIENKIFIFPHQTS